MSCSLVHFSIVMRVVFSALRSTPSIWYREEWCSGFCEEEESIKKCKGKKEATSDALLKFYQHLFRLIFRDGVTSEWFFFFNFESKLKIIIIVYSYLRIILPLAFTVWEQVIVIQSSIQFICTTCLCFARLFVCKTYEFILMDTTLSFCLSRSLDCYIISFIEL